VAPSAPPSAVRQLGDDAEGVANQVPVAGEPASDVVGLLVDTVDGVPLPQP